MNEETKNIETCLAENILAEVLTVILCLCLSLSSCKTVQTQTEYKERVVEVRVRDTAIVTVADSASVRALLHCDSAYNVVVDELTTLQGARIKADVHTKPQSKEPSKGLSIAIDCKEDSMRTIIYMRDSIISDLTQQVQTISVSRERSGYDKFTSWWFWVTTILLLLVIAYWVCDKIPACKPYTAVIKGLFKFL